MVDSVAPVDCAVELHLLLPLFTSDMSTIGAADSRVLTELVGDVRTRSHGKLELSSGEGTLYQIAANAHTLASRCYVPFQEPPTKLQCVLLATEPGWLADRCSVSQQAHYRHTLQTHSSSFVTQRTYSCANFVAISSLVLELLKKCRVR